MSITGGIKFFNKNKSLYKDNTAITASSNDASAKYMLDNNKYTQWESVGSNDLTTETIVITMSSARDIDRIFLIGINWKEFNVKYWNGSAYVNFANVTSIIGSPTGISETAYALSTAYYEFDSVNTTEFQIQIVKTQTADQEKEIIRFIATEEIGTFLGYPNVNQFQHNKNLRKEDVLSGKNIIQKSYETTSMRINFNNYPYQDDIDILAILHDSIDPFLVWPCGGRYGTTYFKIEQRGWRLEDVFNMQTSKTLLSNYEKNIYINGVDTSISLDEHV